MKVTKKSIFFWFCDEKKTEKKREDKTKKKLSPFEILLATNHMDPPLVALQLFSTTFSTFWNDNLIPNLFLFIFLMSSDLSAFH